MREVCVGIAALLMFVAGRADAMRDYVVYGTLHVAKEDASTFQCAVSLDHSTFFEHRKFILLTKPDSVLADFCRHHADEQVTVAIRVTHAETKDGEGHAADQ